MRLLDADPIPDLDHVIRTLDALQAQQVGGRGLPHVQTILTYLRRGDFSLATHVARTDMDKSCPFPEVAAFIEAHLLDTPRDRRHRTAPPAR